MDILTLYKSGKFYNAYRDDAIILHGLMNYKFLEPRMEVGFPTSSLSKVKATLENENIPYKIIEKEVEIESFKGIDKRYKAVLRNCLKRLDLEKRLKRLLKKDNITLDILESLVNKIYKE